MADITSFQDLFYGQLETVSSPNPRLASPIEDDDLQITLTSAIVDEDDAVVSKPFLMVIRDKQTKYPEGIYVQAGELSVDGKTITLAGLTQRGVALSGVNGIDLLSGDAGRRVAHGQDSEVRIQISALSQEMISQFITGTIGSGHANLKIGDGTAGATQGFEIDQGITSSTTKYGADASGNPLITLPGGSSFIPGAGAGAISGGDGIDVTASVISADLTDTNVYVETTAGAGDSGKVALLDATGLLKQANIEGWKDVTATATEINQALDGIGATVTDTNLDSLTDGSFIANLHYHLKDIGAESHTVITAGNTDVVSHNLGVVPKWIRITAYTSGNPSTTSAFPSMSEGEYLFDTAEYATAFQGIGYDGVGDPPYVGGISSSKIIYLPVSGSGSSETVQATISADSSAFTLTLTNTSGASKAIYYKWELGV